MKIVTLFLILLHAAMLPAQLRPNIVFDGQKIGIAPSVHSPANRQEKDPVLIELRNAPESVPCQLIVDGHVTDCTAFEDGRFTITNSRVADHDLPARYTIRMVVAKDTSPEVNVAGARIALSTPPNPKTKTAPKTSPLVGAAIPWLDALELEQALKNEDADRIVVILSKYFNAGGKPTYPALYAALKDNPFLVAALPDTARVETFSLKDNLGKDAITAQSANQKAVNGIFNPTIALDALATIIAERLIDELNVAYLKKFKTKLQGSDLQLIFPKTSDYIARLGENYLLDYQNLLYGLRQNLFTDLSSLLVNMPNVVKKYKPDFTKPDDTRQYVLILTLLELMNNLQKQTDPAEAISRIGNIDYGLPANTISELQSYLKLAALISNRLRISDKSGSWISSDNADFFLQSPRAVFLFAGLVFRLDEAFFKAQKVNKDTRSVTLYELITDNNTKITDLIYQGLSLIVDVAEIRRVAPKNTTETNFDHVLTFTERLLSFLINATVDEASSGHFQEALTVVGDLLNLKRHILNKEYVAAGTVAIDLVRYTLSSAEKAKLDTLKPDLFRYLTFAQSLIDAHNRDELVAAMKQTTAPVGSYRQKRLSPLTVSLSAYPSLYAGQEEFIAGINNPTFINSFGFSAPFGLAVSTRLRREKSPDRQWSLGLFLPIVDVGAITAFRLLDRQTELPDLTWQEFISPGAFINLGFPRTPLGLNIGMQYGPNVEKIDPVTGKEGRRLWRYTAGIAVDLHLWNIYTKSILP